ncbi:MAG TPA: hypothetical protein VFK54_09280 [Candidatus Limnocylindrales bacterium]|nr:hypothetical protein [Candidatus Limnocylindrales bacterium]
MRELEPDLGLAERYVGGRRAIEARARAADWQLDEREHALAQQLIAELGGSGETDVVDLLDTFPTRFLQLLERRTPDEDERATRRRRFADRLEPRLIGAR